MPPVVEETPLGWLVLAMMGLGCMLVFALLWSLDWLLRSSFLESLDTQAEERQQREQLARVYVEEMRRARGCCPFVRSGGLHGEDCNALGRGPCTWTLGAANPLGEEETKG